MTQLRKSLAIAFSLLAVVGAVESYADQFEVTVINITRGQQFTPLLVATSKGNSRIFTLGSPASSELRALAEEGNTAPLMAALSANSDFKQVVTVPGLLDPGKSATTKLNADDADYLTVAAMLIPTNDGFLALNGVRIPKGGETIDLFVPAYDAGTERNDELCASIPGPFFIECGGPGKGGVVGGGEGFVHVHSGIHGVGDLKPALRDWKNPVALITVRRVRS
jgi:spondin N